MKKEKWEYLRPGNIVRWGKNIWIVQDIRDGNNQGSNGVTLIAFWGSACIAYPSKTWPDKKSLNQIKYVAECGRDFVRNVLEKSMKEIEEIMMPHEEEDDDLFSL